MTNEPTIAPTPIPADWINCISTMVSIYAIGSLLPLSNSNMGRRLCFRFIFCERRIANTEAESVDDIVAANNNEVVIGR